jgi:hypothetical protein
MTPHSVTFASSSFWPIAIGFFGLGTGTPLHGVKRRAERMDSHRLPLRFGPRSICVRSCRRRPRYDRFCRLDLDLSYRSSNAIGWMERRLVALLQCLTGIWLMYCTWAVTVNIVLGYKLWI